MVFDVHSHISKEICVKEISSANKDNLIYKMTECKAGTLAKEMLKNNVTKSCIFPFPFPETIKDKANNYIIESYKKNMELFIPFLLIGDNIDDSIIKKNKVMGFKEHFALGHYKDKKYFNMYYKYLEENNLFLIIHPHMSERIEKIKFLKKEFPKLKIILAHSGRRWPFTGDDVIDKILPELYRFDNLYFDTSTIRNSATIAKMVQICGSERILFGSDFPFYKDMNEDTYYEETKAIVNSNIKIKDMENIFTDNFSELFLFPNDYQFYICLKDDEQPLLNLIRNISSTERKFLAIDKKINNIKRDIKQQSHLFLIRKKKRIVGFVRETGRKNNGAVIEEIYVHEFERNKGLSKKIIKFLLGKFNYLEAKTFSSNTNIIALFFSMGGRIVKQSPQGRILYWKIEDQ